MDADSTRLDWDESELKYAALILYAVSSDSSCPRSFVQTGPTVAQTIAFLGKDETLARLQKAIQMHQEEEREAAAASTTM